MACYVEEEEVWKCPKHPSKRRRSNGICPTCLRERLDTLCPDCHHARPCACATSAAATSSSDEPPSFARSRSVAIPFLRSRKGGGDTPNNSRARTPSFLSILNRSKTKRGGVDPTAENDVAVNGGSHDFDSRDRIEDFARMVTRSRSVSGGSAAMTSGSRRGDVSSSPAKGRFWNFPSPMKAFRSSRTPKVVVQDRSPLHRG